MLSLACRSATGRLFRALKGLEHNETSDTTLALCVSRLFGVGCAELIELELDVLIIGYDC